MLRVASPAEALTREGDWDLVPARATQAVFLLAHVPIGLIVRGSPTLAALHGALVLCLGLWWGAIRGNPARALNLACYIAAAEVLWRMSGAPLPWEFSKYGLIAILGGLALRRSQVRSGLWPVLAFMALVSVSAVETLRALGATSQARGALSFTLSGPLALGVVLGAFRGRVLDGAQIRDALVCMLASVIAASSAILAGLPSAEEVVFTGEANFATSGGFGPNQVSAVLGFGALACVLLVLLRMARGWQRWVLLALAAALLGQSALTMSRGGALNVAVALVLAGSFALRDRRLRLSAAGLGLGLCLLLSQVVVPWIEDYSRGAVSRRFTELNTSRRWEILEEEVALFMERPLLGVGPGLSTAYRQERMGIRIAPHTEYSRVLAEHGLAGLLAGGVLLGLLAGRFRRTTDLRSRMLMMAFMGWTAAEMLHSAWRLALPSLLLGLCGCEGLGAQRASQPVELPTDEQDRWAEA